MSNDPGQRERDRERGETEDGARIVFDSGIKFSSLNHTRTFHKKLRLKIWKNRKFEVMRVKDLCDKILKLGPCTICVNFKNLCLYTKDFKLNILNKKSSRRFSFEYIGL